MGGLAEVIAAMAAAAAGAEAPRVEIAYPRLIERYCAQVSSRPPEPKVLDAIAARLPELRAAWERDGPALLAANARLTGRPWPFAETQAVLHGCDDLGSLSQPLLIAAGRFTPAWAERPGPDGRARAQRPVEDFVNSLWHEVSHRFLSRIIEGLPGRTTPARERHKAESVVVRNHMHLFALEELVYRGAGRAAEFEARRQRVMTGGDPELAKAYRLAMEEGAEALVAELRAR